MTEKSPLKSENSAPDSPKPKRKDLREELRTSERDRVAEARRRLGIGARQMEGVIRIAPLLKKAGLTIEDMVEILQADPSAEAQGFLAIWRRTSVTDRTYLTIEEFAVAAGLTSRRLWEVLSGAAMQQSRDVVAMMVSVAQPKVVAKTIELAQKDGGVHSHGAREHLFKAVGFLPTPKGSSISVNVNQRDDDDDLDYDGTGNLPTMDSFLLDVQKVIHPKQLAAALPPAPPEEKEVEELPPGEMGE